MTNFKFIKLSPYLIDRSVRLHEKAAVKKRICDKKQRDTAQNGPSNAADQGRNRRQERPSLGLVQHGKACCTGSEVTEKKKIHEIESVSIISGAEYC